MSAFSRLFASLWFFLILAFSGYGLWVTSHFTGETFGQSMYLALMIGSVLCIATILEPIRERA
jgi:hypothetical protein